MKIYVIDLWDIPPFRSDILYPPVKDIVLIEKLGLTGKWIRIYCRRPYPIKKTFTLNGTSLTGFYVDGEHRPVDDTYLFDVWIGELWKDGWCL